MLFNVHVDCFISNLIKTYTGYTISYVDILHINFYGATFKIWKASVAQLGEIRTLDSKVAGSILTRDAVLCP